ncbi:MAG: TRM11 family methyltransferase [Candidatus Thermoplasmatota archaeon]
MKLLCELSKEHSTLPKAEIKAGLAAEEIQVQTIEEHNNLSIFDISTPAKNLQHLFTRLALTFHFYDLLFSCEPDLNILQQQLKQIKQLPPGTIAISKKNLTAQYDTKPILHYLQTHFTKNRTVNLTNPTHHLNLFFTNEQIYVGRLLHTNNRKQYEQRKVQYRPFFSPISLHPKWARTLVNLSQIKRNQTLLDPFCGTGGILLEAGLLGINIIGSDIEEKMIIGCKQSLNHYSIQNFMVFQADISELPKKLIKPVDAVVTDFPYGRSTTTKKEDIQALYHRAYRTIAEILKKNGRAVIGLSDTKTIPQAQHDLELIEIHEFRVHKSLTRYFCVFQK